ncbi:MAG: VWA domain-containing protein [Lachnospiraceae bacterium]|nr:VWA domain-containing protein [Lachnospiraceae bacterium]
MRRSKLFIGGLLTMTMIVASAFTSFADNSVVSKTQDNITVTKSAEWTTVDGKSEDSNGNRYAKINFKIDTTKATTEITNTVSKGGDTDIVLILDSSGSMIGNKTTKMKEAANSFVNEVLAIPDVKVNVGVVTFFESSKVLSPLTNSKANLNKAINDLQNNGGTKLAPGVKDANNMLRSSQAKNKFFIILSDGEVFDEAAAQNAITDAFTTNPSLKVITIGYDTDTKAENFLRGISTPTSTGTMFYTADIQSSSIVSDIKGVFEKITEQVTSYVVGNSLVDTIPKEFSIVDGTITTNDTNLVAEVSEDKKTINWNWGDKKLEKKVYEMSVITVLDKAQVPAECKEVFTNGTTIDVTTDSSKSAIFSYGSSKKLYLNSPILSLVANDEVKVEDEKAPMADNADQADAEIDSTPSTGDTLNNMVFVILGVCAVAVIGSGAVMIKNKRRSF